MDDFLYVLKLQLMDRLMPQELEEQIALYENYINEEIAGGKSLEQVMRKLGDPVKVADMIIAHKNQEDVHQIEKNSGQDISETKDESEERNVSETKNEDVSQEGMKNSQVKDQDVKKDKSSREFMTAEEINRQIQNPEHGFHAEFKENEGWDIRLGKLKLNSWYGTLIILGIVLVIFVLFSELTR